MQKIDQDRAAESRTRSAAKQIAHLANRKKRCEQLHWSILYVLDATHLLGANEQLILSVVRALIADITPRELRRELDYLEEHGLINLANKDGPTWVAKLTRKVSTRSSTRLHATTSEVIHEQN